MTSHESSPQPHPLKQRIAALALVAAGTMAPFVHTGEAADAAVPEQDTSSLTDIAVRQSGDPNTNPTYKIATYNILGADHEKTGRKIGGTVKQRAKRATQVIMNNHVDIVGLQELNDQSNQYGLFKKFMKGYGTAPENRQMQNAIFYNKDRFKLLDWDIVKFPYYGDKGVQAHNGRAVTARLEDLKTHQIVNVLDGHPPAYNDDPGSDKGASQKRKRAAEIFADWAEVTEEKHPGEAVFVLGDLNSTNNPRTKANKYFMADDEAVGRDGLPYCVLTKKPDVLQNTRDMVLAEQGKGKLGTCPDKSHSPLLDHTIDWVFAAPKYTHVVEWEVESNATAKKASDHMPVVVTVQKVEQ